MSPWDRLKVAVVFWVIFLLTVGIADAFTPTNTLRDLIFDSLLFNAFIILALMAAAPMLLRLFRIKINRNQQHDDKA